MKRKCMVTSSSSSTHPAAKGAQKIVQQSPSSSCSPEGHVDEEEEWVTVYGFTYEDTDVVLQEFEKCGAILDYDRGGNWMHILYQNQSEAQKALSKSGQHINQYLIVGVKPVDSVQKQALNARPSPLSSARIARACSESLSLLHRSSGEFYVLAATGNVYTVTLSLTPSCRCNCPDSTIPCKHILFVFLRVLGISQNDRRLWRKGLKPCQLTELLNMPTCDQTLAGARARERFEHLFSTSQVKVDPPPVIKDEDVLDRGCRICFNEMQLASEAAQCGSCGEVAHERCLSVWRKRKAGRVHVCAWCREEWISAEHNWYTNLADYMD